MSGTDQGTALASRSPKRNAKKKANRVSAPREANTNAKICAMPRDNWTWGEYWMLVTETEVTIAKQKAGHRAQWMGTISKRAFNRFVDAYNTGKAGSR